MMRYRTLIILTTVMILSTLHASEISEKTIDVNDLLKRDLSILEDNNLVIVQKHLSHKRSIETKEWIDEHEDALSCGMSCSGLAPIAVGMYFDGLRTIISPSLENLPIGGGLGLLGSFTAMTAFSHWYQPPQTETSKKLALVLQESKRRKEKVD